jgi:hypothetical protein
MIGQLHTIIIDTEQTTRKYLYPKIINETFLYKRAIGDSRYYDNEKTYVPDYETSSFLVKTAVDLFPTTCSRHETCD